MNSFNISINNLKQMITYFKNVNSKPKKIYQMYRLLTSKLESVDTVVIISATTKSVTLSFPGVRLFVVPFSARIVRVLSLGNYH